MKLYFKQRMFSWFDSYDIYYMDGAGEAGAVAFTVEGKLAWGHCLHILDPQGRHIATVQQKVLLPGPWVWPNQKPTWKLPNERMP